MNEVKTRRWPWVVSLLLASRGSRRRGAARPAAAAARARGLAIRPVERWTVQYRDQVATGRSPTGNGIARAHRPPAGTD
ncbi:MAG: hypothetical protein ABR615_05435 [Pseudonocardiaceae bacterium]